MNAWTRTVFALTTPLANAARSKGRQNLAAAMETARQRAPIPQMLERHETTADVPTAKTVDPTLELDYLEHRSAAYVEKMFDSAHRHFSLWAGGELEPEPIDDRALPMQLASINMARFMRGNADGQFVFDLSYLQRYQWFEQAFHEIDHVNFTLDGARFDIVDTQGRTHSPGSPTWLGARNRLISEVCVSMPITHNWTHFWLPDVIAAVVHQSLNRQTTLYRLLAPHIRFTNRHNHAGLWIQNASDNEPGLKKKLVPWLLAPMRKGAARLRLTEEAKIYYDTTDHFAWPERVDTRLPMNAYLKLYYDVIESFVRAIHPHLEADEYAKFAKSVDPWFPKFSAIDPVRALSMILFQVGPAHAVEHLSFTRWARKYGQAEMFRTIEQMSDGKINFYMRYRLLTFIDCFVDYTPPPSGLDLRLVTSNAAYGFEPGSTEARAADAFIEALRGADRQAEASGVRVVELDALIRCICF